MDKSSFRKLIRECIGEVLKEWVGGYGKERQHLPDPNEPRYLHYVGKIPGEEPFKVGDEDVELVKAKYPDGKENIGVLSHKTNHVYSLDYFKHMRGIVEEDTNEDDDPLYVEYVKEMTGEEPFMMYGEKFQYVWAKYPNGKTDIGVYSFAIDLVYGYNAFRQRYNIKEEKKVDKWIQKAVNPAHKGYCTPMTKKTCTPRRKALARRFKKGLEESGWSIDSSQSTENIGKKYLEDAKSIAYKVWGGVYLTLFHSTSKDGNTVFYEVRLHSAQGDRNWLAREKDGSWKASVGHGVDSKWEPVDKYMNPEPDPSMGDLKEMTGTSAVQGFYGKNWVDPDPKRKRMKDIAKKSVGGDLA